MKVRGSILAGIIPEYTWSSWRKYERPRSTSSNSIVGLGT